MKKSKIVQPVKIHRKNNDSEYVSHPNNPVYGQFNRRTELTILNVSEKFKLNVEGMDAVNRNVDEPPPHCSYPQWKRAYKCDY